MAFRQAAYGCLGNARDALFDLADANMLAPKPPSFAHLSLSFSFRRRWPSLYEAIQDGQPDREKLMRLYIPFIKPTPNSLSVPRVILAGDHTTWPLPSSRTLPDRAYQYQPTQVPGGRPVAIGYSFSTIAWVPESKGSWALPLRHERVESKKNALTETASQLKEVCERLGPSVRPIALFDSQYGCAPFVKQTADIACDKIIRLRPNLVLFRTAPPYSGKGAPRKHGPKFRLKDASTWGTAEEELELEDPKHGKVKVQLWRNLHFAGSAEHPMILIRISRPGARGTRRDPKDQWLVWLGQEPPPLKEWWDLYGRRFAIDHWYRFAKGSLHWTLPHFGTTEQYERWSDLMPLLSWQLWLARQIVAERCLPWQKVQEKDLTPGRVLQSMEGIIGGIGTPSTEPKARGKSPGWPKGRERKKKERYVVIKKSKPRARAGVKSGGKKAA